MTTPTPTPTPNQLPTVLGVGSLTPEAIESVIDGALNLYHWEAFKSQPGDIAEAVEDVIRKAIEAAAPFIAAQALRDAAGHITDDYLKRALLARAAAIECAERGLAGADAETAIAGYLATPAGRPYDHDSMRVAAILNRSEPADATIKVGETL